MDCKSIGQANPDIAGIGILLAFVIQSLIAVIVSGYTWKLSFVIQKRWNDADPDPHGSHPDDKFTEWVRSFYTKQAARLESFPPFRKYKESRAACLTAIAPTRKVGNSFRNWLIGKQPDQPRQRNSDSNIEDEITPTTRRLEVANRILLAGSDSQTFTGIALLISALIQSKTLTFYHMHIIYDTISLVIISNCAASICIFRDGFIKGYTRLLLMAIWAVLFIAYTSVFTTRLQKWNDNVSSHCYKTTIIARSNASHPYVDNIYIAVTCMFIALSFIYSLVLSLNSKLGQLQNALSKIVSSSEIAQAILEGYRLGLSYNPTIATLGTDLQFSILSIAMWQCPLHIYSIFALRASNERYLEQGSSEKEWGFGQIAAMALLGGNVLQFVDGVIEYHKTEPLDTTNNRSNEQSTRNQQDVTQNVSLAPCSSRNEIRGARLRAA